MQTKTVRDMTMTLIKRIRANVSTSGPAHRGNIRVNVSYQATNDASSIPRTGNHSSWIAIPPIMSSFVTELSPWEVM